MVDRPSPEPRAAVSTSFPRGATELFRKGLISPELMQLFGSTLVVKFKKTQESTAFKNHPTARNPKVPKSPKSNEDKENINLLPVVSWLFIFKVVIGLKFPSRHET